MSMPTFEILSNPSTRSKAAELMAQFCIAIIEGKITTDKMFALPPELTRDGWNYVVGRLMAQKVDAELIELLDILYVADPNFDSANFLCGLAHYYLGDREAAKFFFEQQAARPDRRHLEESSAYLQLLK